jgi:hypothetical protein
MASGLLEWKQGTFSSKYRVPVCRAKVQNPANSKFYQPWSPGQHSAHSNPLHKLDVSWPTYLMSQSNRQENLQTSNAASTGQNQAHVTIPSLEILCGYFLDLLSSFVVSLALIWSFCADQPSGSPRLSEAFGVLISHQVQHKSLFFALTHAILATWSMFQLSAILLTYRPKMGTKHLNHQSKERSFLLINKWLTSEIIMSS